MRIEVLGPGCPRCQNLKGNTVDAVDELGLDAEVDYVHDVAEIGKRGLTLTPALLVDGRVRVAGRVASVKEIKTLLSHPRP